MNWLRENWIWLVGLMAGMILAAAFASVTCQAGGPVEPPAPIVVPQTVRSQPGPILDAFIDLVRQINDANRFIFEAIRNPLVQDTIVYIPLSDSVKVTWPHSFKDTLYSAAFARLRDFNGVSGAWTAGGRFTVRPIWPESCYVNSNALDSGYVMVIGVGLRK